MVLRAVDQKNSRAIEDVGKARREIADEDDQDGHAGHIELGRGCCPTAHLV